MRPNPLSPFVSLAAFTVAGLLVLCAASASAAPALVPRPGGVVGGAPKKQPPKWWTNYRFALKEARKVNRPVLAYFCGSDWCEWSRKLDKEVLDGELFYDWAARNVVLLKVDFLAEGTMDRGAERLNDALRGKYHVSRTPTFLFLDADGEVIARAGYAEAKLREKEKKGTPVEWIKFCDSVLARKPKTEKLVTQKGLTEAVAYAGQWGLPLLLMIAKGDSERLQLANEELLQNQKFVKFANRYLAFANLTWPVDGDPSPAAKAFDAFQRKHGLKPAELQLVVYDPLKDAVQWQLTTFNPEFVDPILLQLEKQLPPVEYNGQWIEDYRWGRTVSNQRDRLLLVSFTCSDGSEWSQKLEGEIYNTDEFRDYARKNLVLVRVDFPKDPAKQQAQPEEVRDQNKMLLDTYGVRGYPTIVILNPKGQKIGDARYMKGGPRGFINSLEFLRREDYLRRTLPSDMATRE